MTLKYDRENLTKNEFFIRIMWYNKKITRLISHSQIMYKLLIVENKNYNLQKTHNHIKVHQSKWYLLIIIFHVWTSPLFPFNKCNFQILLKNSFKVFTKQRPKIGNKYVLGLSITWKTQTLIPNFIPWYSSNTLFWVKVSPNLLKGQYITWPFSQSIKALKFSFKIMMLKATIIKRFSLHLCISTSHIQMTKFPWKDICIITKIIINNQKSTSRLMYCYPIPKYKFCNLYHTYI